MNHTNSKSATNVTSYSILILHSSLQQWQAKEQANNTYLKRLGTPEDMVSVHRGSYNGYEGG
jgi:nitrogenase molybdenum-iron protein alpha/beta subunit